MPSKKIRGRILTIASAATGRPSSLTVNRIFELLPSGTTSSTSPTLTPAIRTGDPAGMSTALAKVASSSYP